VSEILVSLGGLVFGAILGWAIAYWQHKRQLKSMVDSGAFIRAMRHKHEK